MEYYELKIKVILSEDMEYTKTSYKIGVFINNSMLNNKLLKKLHEERFYKYVTLLGNKLNIKVKSDELSQKKALMAIALGLGEKGSSLGAGFCNYI